MRIISFATCAAITAVAAGALALPAAAAPAANPLAGLSGTQIANKALADMKSASSFHLKGTLKDSGKTESMDIWLSKRGCLGSLGGADFILIGTTTWLKVSGVWSKITGQDGQTISSAFSQFCYPAKFAHLYGYPVPHGILGRTAKIGRTAVVAMTVPSMRSVFYISVSAKPEILMIKDAAASGSFSLSGYGQRVTLTPPTS